jgi:hypothetical protein
MAISPSKLAICIPTSQIRMVDISALSPEELDEFHKQWNNQGYSVTITEVDYVAKPVQYKPRDPNAPLTFE